MGFAASFHTLFEPVLEMRYTPNLAGFHIENWYKSMEFGPSLDKPITWQHNLSSTPRICFAQTWYPFRWYRKHFVPFQCPGQMEADIYLVGHRCMKGLLGIPGYLDRTGDYVGIHRGHVVVLWSCSFFWISHVVFTAYKHDIDILYYSFALFV